MTTAGLIVAVNATHSEAGRGLSTGAGIAIMLGALLLVAIVIGAVWRIVATRASLRPRREPQEPGHAGRIGS